MYGSDWLAGLLASLPVYYQLLAFLHRIQWEVLYHSLVCTIMNSSQQLILTQGLEVAETILAASYS